MLNIDHNYESINLSTKWITIDLMDQLLGQNTYSLSGIINTSQASYT